MKAFDMHGNEFDVSTESKVYTHILSPIILEYQQVSDLLDSLLKRFENDVVRYDRAVGSKKFMKHLRFEFYEKWKNEDEKFISFVNRTHSNLRISKG